MSARDPFGACLDAGALAGHREWRETDPRLAHLRACGRCRALLASLERFEAKPDDVPAAQRADARERLARARRDWPQAEPGPAARRAGPAGGWPAGWFGPGARAAWRPALAVAALAIVAASVHLAGRPTSPGRDAAVLRSGEERPVARPALAALPPLHGGSGTVLRWHTLPGADAYEVTLYGAAFESLARVTAGRDTQLALGTLERAAGPAGAGAAYWQVVALRAGDVLAESAPEPLGPAAAR